MKTILSIIFIVLLITLVGCSDDSTSTMDSQNQPNLILSPADGATNVRIDDSIILTFAKPVDRATVQNNFHLIGEKAMADSSCPISDTMSHGMMNETMMDSMKMNHLMNQHSAPGRFSWDSSSTVCTFHPDSMLISNMRYMVHLGDDMMSMMQNRMGNTGMMNGHGNGEMANDMMYHFRTMDSTQTGGGHNGHH